MGTRVPSKSQHILEPGVGIDSHALTRGHETAQYCCRVAALVAAKEDPVVAADRDAANAPLGAVVVDLQIAILAVAVQRGPVLQRVAYPRPTGLFGSTSV